MRNRLHLSFSGEIYERTRKLDTQSALQSTRRSRDIPILVKNIRESIQAAPGGERSTHWSVRTPMHLDRISPFLFLLRHDMILED